MTSTLDHPIGQLTIGPDFTLGASDGVEGRHIALSDNSLEVRSLLRAATLVGAGLPMPTAHVPTQCWIAALAAAGGMARQDHEPDISHLVRDAHAEAWPREWHDLIGVGVVALGDSGRPASVWSCVAALPITPEVHERRLRLLDGRRVVYVNAPYAARYEVHGPSDVTEVAQALGIAVDAIADDRTALWRRACEVAHLSRGRHLAADPAWRAAFAPTWSSPGNGRCQRLE